MAEEESNFSTYFPIINYQYELFFKTVQFKEKTLNEEEKAEFVKVVDETVSSFASGLPYFTDELNSSQIPMTFFTDYTERYALFHYSS
ncbi:MAG: hypothetical protein IKH00_07240 [Bacteroidales bacterium]|nr:hypothetical protein [Bacteroidales bacterium]